MEAQSWQQLNQKSNTKSINRRHVKFSYPWKLILLEEMLNPFIYEQE
jgi:hypothetical protein